MQSKVAFTFGLIAWSKPKLLSCPHPIVFILYYLGPNCNQSSSCLLLLLGNDNTGEDSKMHIGCSPHFRILFIEPLVTNAQGRKLKKKKEIKTFKTNFYVLNVQM